MKRSLLPALACPRCHGELGWAIGDGRQGDILTAEAGCRACRSIYPVRDGIAAFLLPDPARVDLWETSATSLRADEHKQCKDGECQVSTWHVVGRTTGLDRFVQVLMSGPSMTQLTY
jgi:uncharacterized protein YbaR (Trm112 family)